MHTASLRGWIWGRGKFFSVIASFNVFIIYQLAVVPLKIASILSNCDIMWGCLSEACSLRLRDQGLSDHWVLTCKLIGPTS